MKTVTVVTWWFGREVEKNRNRWNVWKQFVFTGNVQHWRLRDNREHSKLHKSLHLWVRRGYSSQNRFYIHPLDLHFSSLNPFTSQSPVAWASLLFSSRAFLFARRADWNVMTPRERHSQPASALNEISDTGCSAVASSPQLLLLCRQQGFHVNPKPISRKFVSKRRKETCQLWLDSSTLVSRWQYRHQNVTQLRKWGRSAGYKLEANIA